MVKGVRPRYLAIKLESGEAFPMDVVMKAVLNSVCRLYGVYGLSKVSVSLIEYEEGRRYIILRCNHTSLDMLRSSVASVVEIGGKPVYMRVVTVSGTLRAIRKRISGEAS